ncbi:hypothetical protein FRC02_002453 [Tulasnella sp. 418]|nr:hypothetical protein FRC02_002453 [Tulasnella sp. 418]
MSSKSNGTNTPSTVTPRSVKGCTSTSTPSKLGLKSSQMLQVMMLADEVDELDEDAKSDLSLDPLHFLSGPKDEVTSNKTKTGPMDDRKLGPDFLDHYGAIQKYPRKEISLHKLPPSVYAGKMELKIINKINNICKLTSKLCWDLDQPKGIPIKDFNWLFSRCHCNKITTRRFQINHIALGCSGEFKKDPAEELLAVAPVSVFLPMSDGTEDLEWEEVSVMTLDINETWRRISEGLDCIEGLDVPFFSELFVQCGVCTQVMTSRILAEHTKKHCKAVKKAKKEEGVIDLT